MAKTGIELPKSQLTGIDPEHVKAHLDYHSEINKVNAAVREKWLEQLFSANFLVFIVTFMVVISGFILMSRGNVEVDSIMKYWQLILPVVTTYIGYAIGKGVSSNG
ncbi:hypothetical protein [Aeromonas veronii]|uniref:hypothetical protein n=1 Tax=Aeromonas veronii TaxID=654 RepID=UPI002443C19B|nr:hypothetical protein [Aeromonas veronii]